MRVSTVKCFTNKCNICILEILNRPLKLKAFQDSVKELPKVNLVCMGHVIGHLRK